jgi:hypothetical protein
VKTTIFAKAVRYLWPMCYSLNGIVRHCDELADDLNISKFIHVLERC